MRPRLIPISTVLKNIPGLGEAEQLAVFERNAVAWRSLSIPTGHYDVAHLKAIHKHLFQDVYGWAGEFRTIPMAKGASRFAQSQYIEQETRKILGRIAVADMHTAPLGRFTAALAEMISELNAVHPFRPGYCAVAGRGLRPCLRPDGHYSRSVD